MKTIQQYVNENRAFTLWAQENYIGDRAGLAQYLLESIAAGEPDCIFFELLALTGDRSYNGTTLLKAADLVLNTKPQERKVSNE